MTFYVEKINVTFHTNNDDKDDDTEVLIDLCPLSGNVKGPSIARYWGNLDGHLADNSDKTISLGTNFRLPPLTAGTNYVLTVAIEPNGHDTWRFDCFLEIYCSDQVAPRRYTFPGHWLSQNTRSNDYPFLM